MSYGVNAPQGLVPRRYFNNAPWDGGGIETFQIASGYATSLFTGDPVTINAAGYITQATVNQPILGVFNGCQYQILSGTGVAATIVNSAYWPANTQVAPNTIITAYVICDPKVVYDVQVVGNGAENGAALSSTLSNANFLVGMGNTKTGQSTTGLDISTLATTAALNLKILGLTPITGNQWSVGNNFGYNNLEVIINNSLFSASVTGI